MLDGRFRHYSSSFTGRQDFLSEIKERGIGMEYKELQLIANDIRKGIIEAVYRAGCGHPGGSLSAAEILAYLYFKELNIDEKDPGKEDRDRFILSKGHITPGYYAVLANRGFFPVVELSTFRKIGSRLQGHPDMKKTPGVDMSSGSLGQGISVAAGMALSGKLSFKNYRVYALAGDGEIQEGQVWEAAMFAAHRKLDNLVVIVDNNNLQIDGTVEEICSPYPIDKKFEAFGFHAVTVNGHNFEELEEAFLTAKQVKGKPTVIITKTIKGKGISFMEDNLSWHSGVLNEEQYQLAMDELERERKLLCQES